MAASLTRAGVEFDFGQHGQSQPDFVLPAWGLGIEVGSRVVDGMQQLVDEISAVAEARHEQEHVLFWRGVAARRSRMIGVRWSLWLAANPFGRIGSGAT